MLARLADIQTEMVRRGTLEQERATLLQRAGAALGVPATAVTLERLCALVTPAAAAVGHASAPPSCAACSPRSPASTASTAR